MSSQIIHFRVYSPTDEVIILACRPRPPDTPGEQERDLPATTDPYQVTCGRCWSTILWRRAVGLDHLPPHIVVPLMRNNCRVRIEARPAAWTRRIVVVSVMAGNKPLWRQQANVALKEQLLAAAQRWVQSRGLQLEEARPDEQHDKT